MLALMPHPAASRHAQLSRSWTRVHHCAAPPRSCSARARAWGLFRHDPVATPDRTCQTACMSELTCNRCHRPTAQSVADFERHEQMHHLCFHYEVEHGPQDVDSPCSESCPSRSLASPSDRTITVEHLPETGGPPEVVEEVLAASGRSTIGDLVINNNGSIAAEKLRFRIRSTTPDVSQPPIYLNSGQGPDGWSAPVDVLPRSANAWTCVPLSGPCEVIVELEWLEDSILRSTHQAVRIS